MMLDRGGEVVEIVGGYGIAWAVVGVILFGKCGDGILVKYSSIYRIIFVFM